MWYEMYFRAMNIIKKIDENLDSDSSFVIIQNIKYFLSDGRIPQLYLRNLKSPQTTIVREIKSLKYCYIETNCYHDGYSWGCWICEGEQHKHVEGDECIKKWRAAALNLRKEFKYDEFQTLSFFHRYPIIVFMHCQIDDFF